jgi:uncharacterized protein
MILRTCVLTLALVASSLVAAAEPMKCLLVDGRNNHPWKETTPVLKKALEGSGLFTVDVATAPPDKQDQSGFQPTFSDYKVVVLNYNDMKDLWPEATRKALVSFVENGGGLVVVHAANNAFPAWPEYNEMIGIGWRDNKFGERVSLDESGKLVRTPKGEGPGAGHGPQHAFEVVIRQPEHPIVAGLPTAWMHASDELYHGQRGPATGMEILATAWSDKAKGGTASHEPMIWVINRGKGRVVTNVMGHSVGAMKCVGFQTTLNRGAEWAATGKVTQTKVPENFPTKEKTASVE